MGFKTLWEKLVLRSLRVAAGHRLFRAALLVLPALPACVTTPVSHTTVPPGTGTVTFSGVYPSQTRGRHNTVQLQVWNGTDWINIGPTVEVGSDSRWTISDVPVPDAYFTGYCETAVFRAAADDGSVTLLGKDQVCLDAAGPDVTLEEAAACLTDRIVVSRRAPGATYVPPGGELRITSQDEADGYQCVSVVDGNMTIIGESRPLVGEVGYVAGLTLSLPNLTAVTGRLSIDGVRTEHFSLPSLTRVGTAGNTETGLSLTQYIVPSGLRSSFYTHVEAPLLTYVNGTLDVQNANPDHVRALGNYDFGLPDILIAENVRIHNTTSEQAHIRGFSGLTRVRGDVHITSDHWEIMDSTLMPSLTDIDGSLFILAANQIVRLLPALVHIGQDLSIAAARIDGAAAAFAPPGSNVLPALSVVDGDLSISGGSATVCRMQLFTALTRIGGALRLTNEFSDGTGSGVRIGSTGSTPLTVGHLDWRATRLHLPPLNVDAIVVPTGTVVIDDNTTLCQCTVDAFIDLLRSRGFSGSVHTTGNAAACAAPCPHDPSCP